MRCGPSRACGWCWGLQVEPARSEGVLGGCSDDLSYVTITIIVLTHFKIILNAQLAFLRKSDVK